MKKENEVRKISGIIVVRNEEDYIINSITSLINQDLHNVDYEILIVDGESTDQTTDLINKYIQNNITSIPIKLIMNPNKSLASGWNLALKNTQSQYVFRIDAHSIIPKDYILRCLEVLEKHSDI